MSASPSPSRQHPRLWQLDQGHTQARLDGGPLLEGATDVDATTHTPFHSKQNAAPVRFIVQRVRPTYSDFAPQPTQEFFSSLLDVD